MLNELTYKKPAPQFPKPLFGYFPKPGKQEPDRELVLKQLEGYTGLSSSNNLSSDQEHLKSEAAAIFGKSKALTKYLQGISKPKATKEQTD